MATDASTTEPMAARLSELESRGAISDLVSDYCHGFDKRDYGRFLAIWSADCVWDIGPPFGSFQGHTGIREAIYDVLWPAWNHSHHLTSNLRIQFHGTDHASGMCDVQCMGSLAGENTCTVVGASYYDEFRRQQGSWKISRRKVTIHYFNPIPGAVLSAPEAD